MLQPYDLSLEELRKYKPALTRQPDFFEFWESTKRELAKVPLEYELQPYDYPAKGVMVTRITFAGLNVPKID